MKFVCPSCERPIYNRRIEKCEFCGDALPNELLYSQNDVDNLDRQQAESLKRQTNTSSSSSGGGADFFSIDFGDSGGCD
ncbi:hypothetical protein Q4519_20380 [Motilimonas sp. 1_MG-2023]|uniref:hypothetical protein n=1 Tax=Motilimonas sp. 1_MG-2023 TaxID=3062672 RepID=UPI0026E45E01|nr:hypothetical protein [Motilimonas sp. 1_MG-2023]MDO6528036.1 hypothetical protein [Motilimonas sp. 1_MG-2023]